MRLIAMLLAVLIIGFLVYKQMYIGSDQDRLNDQTSAEIQVPKVPSNPNQIRSFEKDMNTFVQDQAENTRAQIEAAEMK